MANRKTVATAIDRSDNVSDVFSGDYDDNTVVVVVIAAATVVGVVVGVRRNSVIN